MFQASVLESLIRKHYPEAENLRFERIPTGKFNTSYLVFAGERQWVLRIAPPPGSVFCFYEKDMMRQEPEIHRILLEQTTVPVARIDVYDDSHDTIGRDYLLMERLEGRPLTEHYAIDENSVLYQTGQCLAQAHRISADTYGYIGAHHPMPPQPSWNEAFHLMWNKLIDDVCGTGYYDDSESSSLRRLLDQNMHLFDRRVPSSMLHMDVWHQNILADDQGNLTGLVDWDRCLWGDPEIEFAVLDYCGISEPAFWEGYGSKRDTSQAARTRNIFYLLYELQKYIVIRHGRNHQPGQARQYKNQVMQIVSRYLLG
jgi:aminoglycoside phosphotransferase (APT) family kinase protein